MIENLKTYLLDILSVLLPGALLLAVFTRYNLFNNIFKSIFPETKIEWLTVLIYTGTAYILGHFVFFIGSFLDDWIFENVKRVFWNDNNLTAYTLLLKKEKTGIEDRSVLNAFEWSCAWLLAYQPGMYSVVERYIAESKFFRSLIVVLSITLVVFLVENDFLISSILLLLIIFSLIRYLSQRQKSIETAYQFVITVNNETLNNKPDENILSELNKRNINPCLKIESSSTEGNINRIKKLRFCSLRKLFVVLQLCLNPFYKRDR